MARCENTRMECYGGVPHEVDCKEEATHRDADECLFCERCASQCGIDTVPITSDDPVGERRLLELAGTVKTSGDPPPFDLGIFGIEFNTERR